MTCVDADLAVAAELAVGHLVDLGHRRIAFLTAFHDGAPVYGFQYHALAGFERARRLHSLCLDRDHILTYAPECGPQKALRAHRRP